MYIFCRAAPVPHLSPTPNKSRQFSFPFVLYFLRRLFYFLLFPCAKKRDSFCAGLMACDFCLPAADGKQFNILIIQCHLKVLEMTRTFSFLWHLRFIVFCKFESLSSSFKSFQWTSGKFNIEFALLFLSFLETFFLTARKL